ncbi:hypothetical protein [Banggai cardinalfish iridovirus]|uniref:Uncharacterized protein n=1 Tax=Banggai cardinalfish iridovirus TaxID=565290 RepID=A0A6M3QVR0_ISKNV|nr:hypothetical protein [Banggai cardinalfish iridovirus]UWH18793.1 ORF005 [Infectious spleen and kidney necrosis virus]
MPQCVSYVVVAHTDSHLCLGSYVPSPGCTVARSRRWCLSPLLKRLYGIPCCPSVHMARCTRWTGQCLTL